MKPAITIIMATYNRANFIKETLLSIQNQTFANWECIIIDDGGTDNTGDIIQEVLQDDKRFQFLKRTGQYKKGLPGCRNCGLDLAQGDYIVFFDDDDIVHPDNLKISHTIIMNNNVDFCHYQKQSFENEGPVFQFQMVQNRTSLSDKDIESVLTQKIGMASCTVLWSKKCFESIRFREELLYAEEWECYSRIIMNGFRGLIIDSVLYFNRKHPNSNTAEFYRNNTIRKTSKKDAILLVIGNLKNKGFLTNSLIRYFIQMSLQFKEFNLFKSILAEAKMSNVEQIKWLVFYKLLPLRLFLHKFKKQLFQKK